MYSATGQWDNLGNDETFGNARRPGTTTNLKAQRVFATKPPLHKVCLRETPGLDQQGPQLNIWFVAPAWRACRSPSIKLRQRHSPAPGHTGQLLKTHHKNETASDGSNKLVYESSLLPASRQTQSGTSFYQPSELSHPSRPNHC
jgi:hypothetical protein